MCSLVGEVYISLASPLSLRMQGEKKILKNN